MDIKSPAPIDFGNKKNLCSYILRGFLRVLGLAACLPQSSQIGVIDFYQTLQDKAINLFIKAI